MYIIIYKAHEHDFATRTMSTTPYLPGVLAVTLHEGAGFSAADRYRELFNGHEPNYPSPSSRRQYHLPYALLDYERSQVTVGSLLGTTENPRWIAQHGATCKFDISRAAELAIRLYLEDPKARKGSQDVFLGVARISPFDGWMVSGPRWLEIQGGTGKILVSLEYTHVENKALEIDTSDYARLSPSGDVLQVKKQDTQRRYARKTIRGAQSSIFMLCDTAAQLNHPFVAPLAFTHQSTKGLQLYTPFVNGGHLFSHLQGPQRFDLERTRLYAAEIVCALEYLHNANIIGWLKAGNVLLDSLGHVTLCGFGLFMQQIEDGEQVRRRRPEYPAPESLLDDGNTSRAADWWTLGVFLYEMLTGLPPFYDNDVEKIRLNIQSQPLEFPKSFPPSATDVLTKLLDREPGQRLGAGGAAEVKAHLFFGGIDWKKVMERGYEPVFKPSYSASSFQYHGVDYPPERWVSLEERLKQFAGFTYNRPPSKPKPTTTPSQKPLQPITTKETGLPSPDQPAPDPSHPPTTAPPSTSTTPPTLPPSTSPTQTRITSTQALTHAITHRNHPLITALLAQGTSPNFHPSDRPAPPHPLDNGCYIGEARHDPRTDYTPPLVRAVQMGDTPVVRLLLAAGADADVGYHGLGDWEWEEEGDGDGDGYGWLGDKEPVRFVCGRPVQLAMELGWEEVVKVLVREGGADVGLGRPVWDVLGHECKVVPRGVYLRVVRGLREVVAGMGREVRG
ncbi:kinase-like domain-containing protein [Chaetomium fimeti]|uniref:Kinase-like domain-containing protein n=1 Tax=Chaetomium fimeti TaxID=1854472 RepID=A0AAE0HPN3_9PEZI|nr:kinase-like domain-containing protein [Chaetomium fimeti]